MESISGLIKCCIFNDFNGVIFCLKNGDDPNECCDGISPLYFAVNSCNLEIVRILLEYSAVDISEDGEKYSPLILACLKGLTDIVKLLIEHNFNMNILDFNLYNILHNAIISNNYETVKYLLSINKTLINRTGPFYEEYIGISLNRNPDISDEILNLLISEGASLNFLIHNSHVSMVKNARYSNSTIKRMLKLGANINEFYDYKNLLMMVIDSYKYRDDNNSYYVDINSSKKEDYKFIVFLIDMGIDLKFSGDEFESCLEQSIEYGLIDLVNLLLISKININIDSRYPALHRAIDKQSYLITKKLLLYSADINIVDDDGETAIELAYRKNLKIFVDLMVAMEKMDY
jgi:ankyrin repeat protein